MKVMVRMFGLMVAALALGTSVCVAEDAPAAPAQPAAPAAGAPSAEQMEQMKKLSAPGDAHKALETLAGKWNYTAKFTMAPGGPTEETTGTSDNELIFGGRFLKESVKGTFAGQPFEGLGYMGYDNVKGEYESIWLDGMMTGIMKTSGQYDAATKTFTLSGINSCPMANRKDMPVRSVMKIVDNDHFTIESYAPGPDGVEFKGMELAYTRAS